MSSRLVGLLLAANVVGVPVLAEPESALAIVGDQSIGIGDVAYRLAVEEAYGVEASEAAALVALVAEALEREIAKAHEVAATQGEILALSEHTNSTTRAPETLTRVKAVFAKDKRAYERLFLEPKIINQKLRSWYSRNPTIHTGPREQIESALSLVQGGMALSEAAHTLRLAYSHSSLSRKPLRPSVLAENLPQRPRSGSLVGILESLKAGQVYPGIVEDDHGYRILLLAEYSTAALQVEEIAVSKRPFADWLREQAAGFEIRILNDRLARQIAAAYPELWWFRHQ